MLALIDLSVSLSTINVGNSYFALHSTGALRGVAMDWFLRL